jgi:LPXTG-motif cell wall-anchored protein
VLLATGSLAAAAAPAPAGAAGVAPANMVAQSDNAPSLTPTPQQGTTRRPPSPPPRPSTSPARPPTQLPYTGGDTWLLFLGGIALLLSGIGLRLRAARWRRMSGC